MTNYRDNIGIGSKYTFGTEIEFTGVNIDNLFKIFRKKSLPVRYSLNHKWGLPKYDVWYLDEDSTVTKKVEKTTIGGELSSRIFTDQPEVWAEIKNICTTLKEMGAYADSTCSNHIRVCLSSLKNKPLFFEILSKLIAILEDDIYLFFMGDTYLVRDTKSDYARDLKPYLLSYINTVNFQDEKEYFFDLRRSRSGCLLFTNRDAINLNEYYERSLMEIRYPNGTVNEKTIQNNINFLLKLIDAIDRGLFDPKELSAKVEEEENSSWFIDHLVGKNNSSGFEKLVNAISTSSEDVNDFMTQYERVLSKKKTVNK